MNLILKRKKRTEDYTLSMLYEQLGQKMFVLDVAEAPVAGLAKENALASPLTCGTYKLFLKPDRNREEMIPVFQKDHHGQRLGICQLEEEKDLEHLTYQSHNGMYTQAIMAGRVRNGHLLPDREAFNKFMFRVMEAKQHRETIWVTVR